MEDRKWEMGADGEAGLVRPGIMAAEVRSGLGAQGGYARSTYERVGVLPRLTM